MAAARNLHWSAFSRTIGSAAFSFAIVASPACKRVADHGSTGGLATGQKPAGQQPDPQVMEAAPELVAVLEKALSAYNASDQSALFADFATTATPDPNDRIFTELFEGYYKTEFGKILELRLNPRESSPDANFGMLVYDAKCEKQALAKVSANFVRENGAPKIVQVRMEKVEPTVK